GEGGRGKDQKVEKAYGGGQKRKDAHQLEGGGRREGQHRRHKPIRLMRCCPAAGPAGPPRNPGSWQPTPLQQGGKSPPWREGPGSCLRSRTRLRCAGPRTGLACGPCLHFGAPRVTARRSLWQRHPSPGLLKSPSDCIAKGTGRRFSSCTASVSTTPYGILPRRALRTTSPSSAMTFPVTARHRFPTIRTPLRTSPTSWRRCSSAKG